MKIRMLYVLPAIVMLAGCAATNNDNEASTAPAPTVAPTQRVNAVSDVLGARMDNMLASQHSGATGITR